jgi:predicted GNAT family acetyltransferase
MNRSTSVLNGGHRSTEGRRVLVGAVSIHVSALDHPNSHYRCVVSTPLVSDSPDQARFEVRIDGELAGTLTYVKKRGRLALIHTGVLPAFEGRGAASALVRFALDSARARGLKVIATCPYVQAYLDRHPEDDDIVIGRGGAAETDDRRG